MKLNNLISLSLLLIMLTSQGFALADLNKPILCKQPYALCSAARCIPSPTEKNRSICFCENHEGWSVGMKTCKERKVTTKANGAKSIVSTYSFKNSKNPILTCPAGTYWSDCLDAPCTIDPKNPKKSICNCPVTKSSSEVYTFGGDCSLNACRTGYLSGSDYSNTSPAQQLLAKKLKFNSKKEDVFCPKSSAKEPPEEECVCIASYEPVCGKNGKTYSNPCKAHCAGVTEYTNGEC